MENICLDAIPKKLDPPENASLTEACLFYQRTLEELAPTRQYIAYCSEQVESAWNILQARFIDAQRKLTEVTIVPTTKPREYRRKTDVDNKRLVSTLKKLDVTEDERKKLALVLGIEL